MGETASRKLDVERYAAGELTGAEAANIEQHLLGCASCSSYLARLQAERQEFLAAHPFTSLLPRLRPERSAPSWLARLASAFSAPALRPVLVPACSLLLAAVVATPLLMHRRPSVSASEYTMKGGPVLSYIYKRGGIAHAGEAEQLFRAGDEVQILYTAAGRANITLFSVDGRGNVSFYQPDAASSTCSIPAESGAQPVAYPLGIELDNTPGSELVVALFSSQQFDTGAIKAWVAGNSGAGGLAALERSLKGKPPAGCLVATLELKKG